MTFSDEEYKTQPMERYNSVDMDEGQFVKVWAGE